MKPLLIIKLEIVVQATPSRVNRVIRMKIDMFIFRCPPETFNENVVIHSAGKLALTWGGIKLSR